MPIVNMTMSRNSMVQGVCVEIAGIDYRMN